MSSGMNVIKRTYPQIIQHNFQHFLKSFFSPPLSIEKRSNFDNIFRKKIDGKSYNTYLKTTRKTFFTVDLNIYPYITDKLITLLSTYTTHTSFTYTISTRVIHLTYVCVVLL